MSEKTIVSEIDVLNCKENIEKSVLNVIVSLSVDDSDAANKFRIIGEFLRTLSGDIDRLIELAINFGKASYESGENMEVLETIVARSPEDILVSLNNFDGEYVQLLMDSTGGSMISDIIYRHMVKSNSLHLLHIVALNEFMKVDGYFDINRKIMLIFRLIEMCRSIIYPGESLLSYSFLEIPIYEWDYSIESLELGTLNKVKFLETNAQTEREKMLKAKKEYKRITKHLLVMISTIFKELDRLSEVSSELVDPVIYYPFEVLRKLI